MFENIEYMRSLSTGLDNRFSALYSNKTTQVMSVRNFETSAIHPELSVPLNSAAEVLMLAVIVEGVRCKHTVPVDSEIAEVYFEGEQFQTSCLVPRPCVSNSLPSLGRGIMVRAPVRNIIIADPFSRVNSGAHI